MTNSARASSVCDSSSSLRTASNSAGATDFSKSRYSDESLRDVAGERDVGKEQTYLRSVERSNRMRSLVESAKWRLTCKSFQFACC